MKKKKLGCLGENLAREFLGKKGYKILTQNFRSKFGEIDIVAKEGSDLVFVEVKTRWSKAFGSPEEAITPLKISRIIRAAQYYQILHPELPQSLRIDAVAVDLSPSGELKEIRIIRNITP